VVLRHALPQDRALRRIARVARAALATLAVLAGTAGAAPRASAPAPLPFLRGADLSSLPAVEAAGARFHDGAHEGDALALLAARGANAVRVRVWNAPADGRGGLADAVALARRARAAGCAVLLDLHFSDTWADPGHQSKPAAWSALPFDALADSVEAWTRDAVKSLDDAGAPPALVQLGNEIDAGMLWDDGRVGGTFESPAAWARLATLLGRAARGARTAVPAERAPRVLVHLADGGDAAAAGRFVDRLREEGFVPDGVGVSFYPWWHGDLDDLARTLDSVAGRGLDVFVLETAYPFSLGWWDATHNLVGERRQLLAGFPATPDGQRAFLARVASTVRATREARGRGVFVWEPAWVAGGSGSPWENCALFDSTGALLPGASVFGASRPRR
jgi:arabinogalactan endo-1,4-beta-galactosidase